MGHIREGRIDNYRRCPIALALLDAGFENPWVEADFATCTLGGLELTTDLPQRAQDFIQRFDSGLRVRPFWFRAALEDEEEFVPLAEARPLSDNNCYA